jgi:CRISPR-associated endonuclease Cas1
VCVADGYGVMVAVERGALQVHDGIGQERRTRRFDRATHGLSRIVVGNVTGGITFDALRWCEALGIGVLVLGPDDTPLLTSVPRATDDARLRRLQALAPDLPVGLDLARWLIGEKITGQAKVLTSRFGADDEASTLLDLAGAAETAVTIEEVRQTQAAAAACYFQTWAGRPETAPTFVASDRRRVPANWTRYDGRRSVLASANGNRRAERPTNAALNYVFSLLEAEAVMACRAVGIDPGMGLIHLDSRARQSMALDLVEPVRPDAEAFVLDLLATRTFRKADFAQLPDGHVRLMAPFTHELAETLPRWAALAAPVAEKVAHALGQAMAGKYVAVTPLTGRRSRDAAAAVKVRKAVARTRATLGAQHQRPGPSAPTPLYSCPDCGGAVENARHVRCAGCNAKDPRQTPAVRASRGRAISARKRALRKRTDAGLPEHCDRDWYLREVLPRLAGVKLAEIMSAAGCSKGYASVIRKGTYVPHASTWLALAELVGVSPTEMATR